MWASVTGTDQRASNPRGLPNQEARHVPRERSRSFRTGISLLPLSTPPSFAWTALDPSSEREVLDDRYRSTPRLIAVGKLDPIPLRSADAAGDDLHRSRVSAGARLVRHLRRPSLVRHRARDHDRRPATARGDAAGGHNGACLRGTPCGHVSTNRRDRTSGEPEEDPRERVAAGRQHRGYP